MWYKKSNSLIYSMDNGSLLAHQLFAIGMSIAYVDEKGEPIEAYFKKDVLEEYTTNYLKENLARYVTHYKASIYYFDKENQVVCTSSYCRSVKISLDCEINYFFHYTKARNFYINQSYE